MTTEEILDGSPRVAQAEHMTTPRTARTVKIEATFTTGLVRDEHVIEVVEEALRRAFGKANIYTVTVSELAR